MSITSAVSDFLARPVPSRHVAKVMNRISNPTPDNIMPTVALESGVGMGRSIMAFMRSGFLECQERLFEEISVAALWFWGVGWMEKLFDQMKASGPKSWRKMDTSIGWAVKTGTLALTPLENHTPNQAFAQKLLQIKGARLFFSIASSIGLVAFAVPWFNQLKTRWIIKHFYANHKAGHPKGMSPPIVPKPSQQLSFTPPAGFARFQEQQHPTQSPQKSGLKFGNNLLLNQLGHWVQDTNLGRMFAIDSGIFTGRMYNATRRDPWEAVEIFVRDMSSYYFYFLAVSHVMKLSNKLLGKASQTHLLLEPMVAEAINPKILERVNSWMKAHNKTEISKEQLSSLLNGLSTEALNKALGGEAALKPIYEQLKTGLRSAPRSDFESLLAKELQYFFPKGDQATTLQQILMKTIPTEELVSIHSAEQLVKTLEQTNLVGLESLGRFQRQEAVIAVKQAFQQSVGMTRGEILKSPGLQQIREKLSAHDWVKLTERLRQTVDQDGMTLLNSRVRRNLVLAKGLGDSFMASNEKLIDRAESLAQWVEKATGRGMSFRDLLRQETLDLVEDIARADQKGWLKEAPALSQFMTTHGDVLTKVQTLGLEAVPAEALLGELQSSRALLSQSKDKRLRQLGQKLEELVSHQDIPQALTETLGELGQKIETGPLKTLYDTYLNAVQDTLSRPDGRRLSSLHLGEAHAALEAKLDEVLLGGLFRENAAIKQGLKNTGLLIEDSRRYINPANVETTQKMIRDYYQVFLTRLEKIGGSLNEQSLIEEMMRFMNQSRNLRYGSNLFAILFGMFGLGYLIPKLQYFVTAKLTGRNVHPGIEAALKRQDPNASTAGH